jgi:hypothetical protein
MSCPPAICNGGPSPDNGQWQSLPAGRSGAACSADFQGRQARAAGIGFSHSPGGKRSAQASVMEAVRSRHRQVPRCAARQRGPAQPEDARPVHTSMCANLYDSRRQHELALREEEGSSKWEPIWTGSFDSVARNGSASLTSARQVIHYACLAASARAPAWVHWPKTRTEITCRSMATTSLLWTATPCAAPWLPPKDQTWRHGHHRGQNPPECRLS